MDTNEILYKDLSYKIVGLAITENIIDAHIAQTLTFLKATGLRLAIILDFSKEELEYKRIVVSIHRCQFTPACSPAGRVHR